MTNRTLWRAVSAMFALNGALFGVWAGRIPAVAEMHALGPGALGLLLLLLAGGAILSFPLAGRAADRFGAYRVTLRIAVPYALALVLIGLAPNLPTLAVALFFFGATHGAMDVTMNAWAGAVEARTGRRMMSSFHAMFSLGAGLGAASGYLAAQWAAGIALHFTVLALGLLLPALALARVDWSDRIRAAHDAGPAFRLPGRALVLVGLVALCAALGEGAMADWSAVYLVEVAGTGEGVAALGFAVFSAAMVAMRLAGDLVVRRLGPVRTARIAGGIAAVGVALAVVLATVPATLAGFALMGVGYAVIVPMAYSRAATDPVVPPGRAVSEVAVLGYGGMLLGPPLIGFVAEATSLRAAFALLGALAIAMSGLAGVLSVRPGRR